MIQGTKIFITAGDHNLAPNIIHAVLARTENAPPGVKGLSLFIVPKVRINADGSLGEPNDVNCGGIEHKMGLKGSATATLNFGDEGKCHGYILGQEGQGIQLMFQMMNEARLGVGLQGFALGNLAYLYALKYAKERVQGVDIRKMKDPNAPRVTIINHPDVRRMLITMKAYAEGLRALIFKTAYYADLAKVATDPKEKEICENTIDLLIPVVKAYSTDMAFRLTEWAIQIHGGYGYCGEYPVEQLCRDVKITSIYEGTNGIQAMDLVGRKLGRKKGALVMGWMKEINEFVEKHKAHPTLGSFVTQLEQAKNSLVNTAMHFAKMACHGRPALSDAPMRTVPGDVRGGAAGLPPPGPVPGGQGETPGPLRQGQSGHARSPGQGHRGPGGRRLLQRQDIRHRVLRHQHSSAGPGQGHDGPRRKPERPGHSGSGVLMGIRR